MVEQIKGDLDGDGKVDWADFMIRHRVFPRFFVSVFGVIFVDMNFWLHRMVETKVIEGGYFVEVYVGAMVGGFVAIVTGYAKGGKE
jgi:hypothetical protein